MNVQKKKVFLWTTGKAKIELLQDAQNQFGHQDPLRALLQIIHTMIVDYLPVDLARLVDHYLFLNPDALSQPF